MTVRTCAVCGRIGPHPLIWYEEENPAGGVLSRFVEQAPSEEAKDVVCEGCLPKVLEMGIGLCKQLSSIRQNPIGPPGPIVFFREPVTSGIADSESEQVPRQEADAGVTGKGDVGGPVAVEPFMPRAWCPASVRTFGEHEPLELWRRDQPMVVPGRVDVLLSIYGGSKQPHVVVKVCKHCGALYAEVVGAEKKPEGA